MKVTLTLDVGYGGWGWLMELENEHGNTTLLIHPDDLGRLLRDYAEQELSK